MGACELAFGVTLAFAAMIAESCMDLKGLPYVIRFLYGLMESLNCAGKLNSKWMLNSLSSNQINNPVERYQ